MAKKIFRVAIEYTETVRGTAYARVEAKTASDAKKQFEDAPFDYDWDYRQPHDYNMYDWCVDNVKEASA